MNTWKQQQIKEGDKIPFVAYMSKYGVAEFTICIQYKRGKVVRVIMTPSHQAPPCPRFVLETKADIFSFGSRQGLPKMQVWLVSWCGEHKCQRLWLSAPKKATSFLVYDDRIIFCRDE